MTKKQPYWPLPRAPQQRERVFAPNTLPSMTEQSHGPSCDLRLIMDRFTQTGEIPLGNTRGQAEFMEVPDQDIDFQYMQNKVAEAKSLFEQLPQEQKDVFRTPENYVNFVFEEHNKKLEKELEDFSQPTEGSLAENTSKNEPEIEANDA